MIAELGYLKMKDWRRSNDCRARILGDKKPRGEAMIAELAYLKMKDLEAKQ